MRNNKLFKIGLIVVDIIVLAFLVFSYIRWSNSKEREKKQDQPNNNIEENVNSYSSVNFNNFVIKIPSKYKYKHDDKNSDSMIIYTEVESWAAYVEQFETKDKSFMDKYEAIEKNLKESNYDVSNASKKTYNGKDYVVMDYADKYSEQNAIIAYATIDDEYKAEITVYDNEKDKLLETLEIVLDIIATAEKSK